VIVNGEAGNCWQLKVISIIVTTEYECDLTTVQNLCKISSPPHALTAQPDTTPTSEHIAYGRAIMRDPTSPRRSSDPAIGCLHPSQSRTMLGGRYERLLDQFEGRFDRIVCALEPGELTGSL